MKERFDGIARTITECAGSAYATIGILAAIAIWLMAGPFTQFSDTWQLIANTVTTLITNVLAFLILNTQNRDAKAIHAKLDRLLERTSELCDNQLIGIENKPQEELNKIKSEIEHE